MGTGWGEVDGFWVRVRALVQWKLILPPDDRSRTSVRPAWGQNLGSKSARMFLGVNAHVNKTFGTNKQTNKRHNTVSFGGSQHGRLQ